MKAQTALALVIVVTSFLVLGFYAYATPGAPCLQDEDCDQLNGEYCNPSFDTCGGGTPTSTTPNTTDTVIGSGSPPACTSNANCPSTAVCKWGYCTKNNNQIEYTFDTGMVCVANAYMSGGRWATAPACTTELFSLPLPANYNPECLHTLTVTSLVADDAGEVCSGDCGTGGGGTGGTGGSSFVSGTPVMLADGGSKPIEEISVGDRVRSFDPETGTFSVGVVTYVLTRDIQEVYAVGFGDGSNLEVTDRHPFYVRTVAPGVPAIHKYFVQARDLKAGDRVYKADGSRAVPVRVATVRQVSKQAAVYNFNVEPFHTYIANNIMVHNLKPGAATSKPTFSVTGFATVAYGSPSDITDLVDKTSLQFRLRVTDTRAATRTTETTRSIAAQFKVQVLNPSPTQKCVAGAGGKPVLAPLCAGTTSECTQTPTEDTSITAPRCISPASLNGWIDGNSSYQCVNGSYRALVTLQQYRSYGCAKEVTDATFSLYGSYNTSGFVINQTRNSWANATLCAAGCTNGTCRTVNTGGGGTGGGGTGGGGTGGGGTGGGGTGGGGCTTQPGRSVPTLTSITAAPRRVAPTGTINMSSVASDPDTISGQREKVRLVCGTDEGRVIDGTTGGCTGTGGTNGTGGGTGGGSTPNILSTVRAVRANYGAQPSDQELGQMLNEMAWIERAGGWGLSTKSGGTRCPSPQGVDIACDILYHRPSNVIVDVLIAAGEASTPSWSVLGQNTDPSRPWLAPIQSGGSPTGTGGGGTNGTGGTGGGSVPNRFSVVQQVHNENPSLISDCNAFTNEVACRLWQQDSSWGRNGKRGNVNDPSEDAIAYRGTSGPGGVDVIDIIGSCGSPNAAPAWQDVTQRYPGGALGAWVQPAGCGGSPTGGVTASPTFRITGSATSTGTTLSFFGQSSFTVFISYYDALRASDSILDSDFAYLKSKGIGGIRIFPNWWDTTNGVYDYASDTLMDGSGNLRTTQLNKLRTVLTKAQAAGLAVDVSFARETVSGLSVANYKRGIIETTGNMNQWGFSNVLIDIQNEHNGAITYLAESDVVDIKNAIKQVTTQYPIGASVAYEASPSEAASLVNSAGLDVVMYHDSRAGNWYDRTDTAVAGLMAAGKPIYLQEPQRWVPGSSLTSANFITAVTKAKSAGAAAWTFHTEAGFDLSSGSIQSQLSGTEANFLNSLSGSLGSSFAPTWLATTGDPNNTPRDGDGGSGFNPNLCTGSYADSNPTCTFTVPAEWRGGGHFRNLYCRVQDESGLYSAAHRTSVIVDNTPPTSVITAPAANSVQTGNFPVTATDADDSGLGSCYYTTAGTNGSQANLPGGNVQLTQGVEIWRPMDIAYSTRSKVALAAWNYNPAGGDDQGWAKAQLIKSDGTLQGGNFILGTNNDFNGGIKVAYDEDDDTFLAVWGTAIGNAAGPAYGSIIRPDGTFVKQNFVVASICGIGTHASSLGEISYSGASKKFYVPCTRGGSQGASLVVASVSADGNSINEVIVTSGGSWAPSIAAGTNSIMVTYNDANGFVTGRILNNNLGFITAPFQISSQPGVSSVFFNPERNEYDVIYDSGGVVYRRSAKEDGMLTSQVRIAAPSTGVYDITYSAAAGSYFVSSWHPTVDYGNTVYEIKSDWSVGQPFDVAEDTTKPNYVPAITVIDGGVPLTFMNRAGVAFVQFGSVNSAGGSVPAGAKIRTCNAQFTVEVGEGKDCSPQGACSVSVFARDVIGNVGQPYSRAFLIKSLFTNITSPPGNSYQGGNFTVTVQDRSFVSGANLTCSYDVYSIGTASTKTVDDAQRPCNSNFTVNVGPDGDCRDLGQNTCRVISRVDAAFNGTPIQDTSERFYSIDWNTPLSRITASPAGWVSSNFTVLVVDEPRQTNITECQYRVVSNGTETVGWTNRSCGISSPMQLTITVGNSSSKNCRHEGGEACIVHVRPLGRGRTPGVNDSKAIAVVFGNVDTNGFHMPLGALTTNRGINFSGTTRTELRAATFYVCSSRSSAASCMAAYASGNRGQNSANYCGSVTGRCELRCSDRTASFYFAARGIPIGTSEQLTVLSPVSNASCPAFNIEEINRLLGIFHQLDQDLSIQIMQVDEFIRQNGESETANNETLDVLNDALLLTKDHLNYMNVTMRDLTVEKAREIISRSNAALDEINRILRGIISPLRVRLTVDMPPTVRFNRTSALPALITKTGNRTAYAKVHCSVTSPNGSITKDSSSCLMLEGNTTFGMSFTPRTLGQYSYSCTLGRSVRSDCSYEINQTPVTGTFRALPGSGTYIESISAPSTVLRGRSAVVTATVDNPDDVEKFVKVRCDFTDPLGAVRRNDSACTSIDAGGTEGNLLIARSSAEVRMLADRLGNWTISGCQVSASEFSGCVGLVRDNVSLQSASYTVSIPDDVFIESVTLPTTPIINGSPAFISVFANNPTSGVAYVNATCTLAPPYGTIVLSSAAGMEPGTTRQFPMNVTTNAVGTWNVNSCTTYKSSSPDFSNPVATNMDSNPGSFTVLARNNLSIASISVPSSALNRSSVTVIISVLNPSVPRYGSASCVFRNPANVQSANSSLCALVDGSASMPVSMFVDRTGVWNVEACNVFGSVNPDCSSAALHDRRVQAGQFNASTTGVLGFCGDGQVDGNEQCDNGANNGPCNATCSTACVINNCGGCTPGLYHAFNATGTCAEFGNSCVPSGWVNRTAGPCPVNSNVVHITSVSVPSSNVINNTNAAIGITVSNPLSDDRFAYASCFVRNPSGVSQLLTSQCEGIQAGSSRNYATPIFANIVGVWNVTTCTVNASTSCASATRQHSFAAGRAFNVIRGLNLSFESFVRPSNVQVNTNAILTANVRNPSDAARFARVTCSFRKPSNQLVPNSTACVQVTGGGSVTPLDVSVFANAVGTWSTVDCSLRGSLTSDCATLQDSETNIGTFNVTNTCISGLYRGFNATTGECREFTDNCVPSGWINVSQNACPSTGPEVVRVSLVTVPTGDVINNSNININVLATNPLDDDRFASVSCFLRNPPGASRLLTSSCEGISANNARTYSLPAFLDVVGRWNVTTCTVNASTSCASAVQQHSLNASKTINVIRGLNLSFISFTMPGNTQAGNSATLGINIRNPSDTARFARVTCSFRTPSNSIVSNSTACAQVAGTSTPTLALDIFANAPGSWGVDTCSLRGSLTSDCSELHDSRSGLGTFNVTSEQPPPALLGLFISNISVPASAVNNSRINVIAYGRNPNLANSSYAITGCSFVNPDGITTRRISECAQITANTTQQFILSQPVNRQGTWTARDCFINASNVNSCSPSLLHNVSLEARTINVTLPPDLYITSVAAQAEAVNNSNVPIDIFVSNPLNDDRYGTVSCLIENPNGVAQSKQAPCSIITRNSDRRYNVSVFADAVGTWNVRNCSVSAASGSSCSPSAMTSSMINGDIFRVIRGYNLTISSISITSPAYTSTPTFASYTLRNPSASERFGRVTCTFTRSGQSFVNRSSCFRLPPESFVDSRANLTTELAGTWTVTCNAERALDSSCSSVEMHDSASRTFDITDPPDLYIQSYDMPALAPLNNLTVATLRIRNTALAKFYGFAGCTFRNRLNETLRNVSQCEEMSEDTNNIAVGVIPELRGNWSIFGCFVNASRNEGCSGNRTHNVSTVSKSFSVTAPLLRIEEIYLTSGNLVVGDIADITVNVKNIGEREYAAFVNCTIFNPYNASIRLTTPNQTIPLGEVRDFHPQYTVDVPGRWRVSSCSLYRLGSIILEDSESVNKPFNVTYTPPQEECNSNVPCEAGFTCVSNQCVQEQPSCSVSNCPGVKNACFCSGGQCIACGDGYACSFGSCAPEILPPVCSLNEQCPSEQVCINSVCQPRPPECFANSDCSAGQECDNNRCITKSEPIFSKDIMVLLIIILAVIMVPLILFIYIRKSL